MARRTISPYPYKWISTSSWGQNLLSPRAGQGDSDRSQVIGLNSEYWDAIYKSNINSTGLGCLKCIKIKRRTQ